MADDVARIKAKSIVIMNVVKQKASIIVFLFVLVYEHTDTLTYKHTDTLTYQHTNIPNYCLLTCS